LSIRNLIDLIQSFGSKETAPDILFLGDSVHMCTSSRDAYTESLANMLVRKSAADLRTRVFACGAFHGTMFLEILDRVLHKPHLPQAVVLPVNIRSFSPQWFYHPAYQFERVRAVLREYDRQGGVSEDFEIQYPQRCDYSAYDRAEHSFFGQGRRCLGEFRRVLGTRPATAEEAAARKRTIFTFFYLNEIQPDHVLLQTWRSLARRLIDREIHLFAYLTPINRGCGDKYVGTHFSHNVAENAAQVREAFVKLGGSPFLHYADWSLHFGQDLFVHEENPDEHLNYQGREIIADRIHTWLQDVRLSSAARSAEAPYTDVSPEHENTVLASDPAACDEPGTPQTTAADPSVFQEWLDLNSVRCNRLYCRDQSVQTLSSLAKLAQELDPSVVVELGTLAGLSLRTWVASTEQAKIYAVDLSFRKLRETMGFLPVDLSRVTLLEQDILQTDFSSLWTPQDRVIFFVDAHDLPNVPIMEHVLATALPALPDGSLVIVDDLWFSEERLMQENARSFLESRVLGEVDELQCFDGHYAPYHVGGSFMGFAEVVPLLKFVNGRRIELVHEAGSKHACFVWKKEYLSDHPGPVEDDLTQRTGERGCVSYNPLESVPSGPSLVARMRDLAGVYRQGRIKEVFKSLSGLLAQHPHDQGLSYGLAVCLARSGMLSQARDILAKNASDVDHPRYQRLLNDLVQRIGPSESRRPNEWQQRSEGGGMTIFAVPKPFEGHLATIQKNAIRSWTRLRPRPEIVLIGDEAGTREMAEEVGARHIPDIRRNEFGTPLVDCIFQTAQDHASHAIMAYVNADMILFQDFALGIQKVRAGLSKFLLIGRRWDLSIVGEIDFDQPQWQKSLRQQVEEHAMLHGECGLDYFVFPKGLYAEIPPFAIGRTVWDNWLVMTPHKLGVPVVDGTEFITAVHQDHDYGHAVGGRDGAWTGAEARRNRALAGATDNSGRTSGATRALRSDGTIVTVRPREPSYMTATYRAQRSAWLLKQADRLVTTGRPDLAAAKWEEAVVFQEVLLASGWPGDKQPESMSGTDLARHYAATCLRLAQYYSQMGRCERAAATFTRLLDNPCIQMPPDQREKFTRLRNQLSRSARRHPQSTYLPIVAKQLSTGTRTHPVPADPQVAHAAKPVMPATRPALPASSDSDVEGLRMEVLNELERSYGLIPDGVPAKHARAVRLAELFRRAGLVDKSRSYGMEATALKNARVSQSRSPCVASGTVAQAAANRPPKVTVITACRNAERFLPQCLDSVLNQSMSEWELFLLDDGSIDGTRQVMADYASRDARVKPFYFDDQTGPYIRRNFAIERARAPFIVIQDADDIMCPDKLRRLHAVITREGDIGIVGSFYRKFLDEFKGTECAEDVTLATSHEQILELYRTRRLWDFCWHGSAIIRKDLFDEIGLYDENPFGADSFWLAKVAEYARHTGETRLVNIPKFLTLRRVHVDSQTGVLSPLDPRGRRVRYRQYCECRLRRVRDRVQSVSGTDMGRALRACRCGDFLTRFKAQIIAWESEPLGDRVIPGFLQRAVRLFNAGHYISCVNVLNGVESFEPTVAGRVTGYDLLRGMAFFAVRLNDRSRMCLDQEIQRHDNPGARAFQEDAFALSPPVDVRRWCRENAERYDLDLILSDNAVPSETALRASSVAKQQGSL
jgi:predicted O-methyltransferase YrrM